METREFLLHIPSLLAAEAANKPTPLLSLPATHRISKFGKDIQHRKEQALNSVLLSPLSPQQGKTSQKGGTPLITSRERFNLCFGAWNCTQIFYSLEDFAVPETIG